MFLSPLRRSSPASRACLFCVAAACALASNAAAQTATAPAGNQVIDFEGKRILRIEVVGNNRTPTALILAQVRAQEGQPYSSALIDVDFKSIVALDRFANVYPQAEAV